MPGIVNDVVVNEDEILTSGNRTPPFERNSVVQSPMNPQSIQSEGYGSTPMDDGIDTSIQHLYDNVCDMQSSDQSPSRASFGSDGDESRIDSELRHLVGGEMREVEIMEEEIMESGNVDNNEKVGDSENAQSLSVNSGSFLQSKGNAGLSLDDAAQSPKSSPRSKGPRLPRKSNAGVLSAKKQRNSALGGAKAQNGTDDPSAESVNNPNLGPFLLKQARDLISSGDNPRKALEFALRAAKSFEKCSSGSPSLELVMNLHVVAAIHCNLGQYDQAIKVLEQSIEIPAAAENQDQALAKFAGHMQMGDTYAMSGQFENSLRCYKLGLGVQKLALGEMDPRVGETCRYLAEALVQALQFEEAEKLCQMALDIHKESGAPVSLEEAADRRLMGLICHTKGDYEAALEHLVLASMAKISNGQEMEVATVDCSIGDTYLSLSRYDEAVFAYKKALTVYKATKGENHPSVASVFVRLADLYNKTGKLRESKSCCENALRIYGKPTPGIPQEEIASGLTDVSAIYESMNEPEQALKLLKKALKIYANAPGHQSTIAGIEAQMGVMYYMLGNYSESYNSFKSAVTKLRVSGEKKSAFFGIALNQMGLACVQRYAINEAADLFEEARTVLEQEYGPYHPDTLGVYSNLAGTYDAMGRLEDAIGILEYVVGMREEKLGTANPDVDDEKRRLTELLKEAGRVRNRKASSLENLLDTNSHTVQKNPLKYNNNNNV